MEGCSSQIVIATMDILPSDTVIHLTAYLTFADCWSLSRSSRGMYDELNRRLYSIGEKAINDRIMGMIGLVSEEIVPRLIVDHHLIEWAITGSIVWSSLLGEVWEGQDIDMVITKNSGWRPPAFKDAEGTHFLETHRYDVRGHGTFRIPILGIDMIWGYSITKPINHFDIEGCKCYLHDHKLYVRRPSETLCKVTRANWVLRLTGGGDHVYPRVNKARLDKYIDRGITITNRKYHDCGWYDTDQAKYMKDYSDRHHVERLIDRYLEEQKEPAAPLTL